MSQDKYTKLAEAAFGSLNQNNPFRGAPLNEQANKVPHPHVKQLMNKVGKHFEDIGLPGGRTTYTGFVDGKHTFEHELPEDDLGDVSTHHYRVELGDKPRAIHTGEWVEDAEGTNRRENNNPKHNIHLNKDNDKSKVSKAAQQGAMEEEVVQQMDEEEILQELSPQYLNKMADKAYGASNKAANVFGRAAQIKDPKLRKQAMDAAQGEVNRRSEQGRRLVRGANRAAQRDYDKKYPREEVEHIDEGDVIQFPSKPKPTPKSSKVITTATRRPPGPRPVKENLNQRFPDVERDIAAIMKESYKKKKMMEDATNMHITTPEQREDWLNVGRGAMDVVDYINKYKV